MKSHPWKIKTLTTAIMLTLLTGCGGGGSDSGSSDDDDYSEIADLYEPDLDVDVYQNEENEENEEDESTELTTFNFIASYEHQIESNVQHAWDHGATGSGITIGIMDSGFNMHTEYEPRYDRYNSFATMVDYILDPDDENATGASIEYTREGYVTGDGDRSDHGTSVTSIALGSTVGIAPEANIVGADVFYLGSTEDGGTYNWALSTSSNAALERFALFDYDIVNASMTGYSDGFEYQADEIKSAFETNPEMILVASVNNFSQNITDYQEEYKDEGYVIYTDIPEIKDNLIVVGSYFHEMTDDEYVELSGFSNYPGASTSLQERFILAPGEMVYSASNNEDNESYAYYTGTSMAAPVVSGAIALLQSYDSSISAPEAAQILLDTADRNFVNYDPELHGKGVLNIEKALNTLLP